LVRPYKEIEDETTPGHRVQSSTHRGSLKEVGVALGLDEVAHPNKQVSVARFL
jgi:hypothetical protein